MCAAGRSHLRRSTQRRLQSPSPQADWSVSRVPRLAASVAATNWCARRRARARAALLCACGRTARRSRPPRLRDPLASRLCRDAPACACSRRLPIGCVCIQPQQREWQARASARASPAPTATSPSCACRRLQAALAREHAVTCHPRACSSAVPADQNTAGAAGDSTASCVRVAHTLARLAAIAVAAGGAGAAVAAGAAAAAAAVAVAAAAAAAVRTPQPRGQGMPR